MDRERAEAYLRLLAGYALVDSPTALAAWIVEKFWSWTDHDGPLDDVLSRDQVLDNLMLYWLPGTGASAARLYWESIRQVNEWIAADTIDVPAGCSVFPRSSSGRPGGGRRSGSPTSGTGTSLRAAATSPHSSSRSCSPRRSGRSSGWSGSSRVGWRA